MIAAERYIALVQDVLYSDQKKAGVAPGRINDNNYFISAMANIYDALRRKNMVA